MFSRFACCVAFNSFTILITFASSSVIGCGVDASGNMIVLFGGFVTRSVGSSVVVGAAVDLLVLTGTDGEDVTFPVKKKKKKKNQNPACYKLVVSINNQNYILKFTYSIYFSTIENT